MNAGRKIQWSKPITGLVNDQKEKIDAYLPRKCDWTNRLIHSKDSSSVQIGIAEVGENGQKTGNVTRIVLSGYVRSKAQSHAAFETILREKGLYPIEA